MFSWINFMSYAFVTAVTPGPNNITSMTNAGRLGLRRALPFNIGIWVGFSIVMLICAFFCSALSELMPAIMTPMLFVGAAYMLWLAWKTFRSSAEIEERERRGGFISGFTLQFVNPKIYVYGIVSMQAYILPSYHGQWGILALFALLLAFIGFACNMLWAMFGSVFRLLFSRYARVTNAVMALMLVYCAVSLFL